MHQVALEDQLRNALRERDENREQVVELRRLLDLTLTANWEDMPLPEDEEIDSVFPTRSGRHDLYAEALRLVSAKRSKGTLVALVNWLLHRCVKAEGERDDAKRLFGLDRTKRHIAAETRVAELEKELEKMKAERRRE